MELKYSFLLGIAMLVFVMYYLEKQLAREQIFWIFSGAGVLFGLVSAYTVAKNLGMYDYYLTLAVLFVLIAVFYHDSGEEEYEGEPIKKKKRKKKAAAPETKTPPSPAEAPSTPETPVQT